VPPYSLFSSFIHASRPPTLHAEERPRQEGHALVETLFRLPGIAVIFSSPLVFFFLSLPGKDTLSRNKFLNVIVLLRGPQGLWCVGEMTIGEGADVRRGLKLEGGLCNSPARDDVFPCVG